MGKNNLQTAAGITIALWAFAFFLLDASAQTASPKKVLTGTLNFLEATCSSVGILLSPGEDKGREIDMVKLGTPAFHAGIRKGDSIKDFKFDSGVLSLKLQRGQVMFESKLPINPKALRALQDSAATHTPSSKTLRSAVTRQSLAIKTSGQNAPVAVTTRLAEQTPNTDPDRTPTLQASTNQTTIATRLEEARIPAEVKLLNERNLILIVDKSGSMGTKDPECEGFSRFDWCKRAVSGLAQTPGLSDQKLTLIFFNDDLDVLKRCDAAVVERMFSIISPDGRTNLGLALNRAFTEARAFPDRPSVIAVLHDGVVNQSKELESILVQASETVSDPKKLSIVFLQVGQDKKGGDLLNHLDTGLQSAGAKFDIVRTIPFSTLRELGLKEALVGVIKASE